MTMNANEKHLQENFMVFSTLEQKKKLIMHNHQTESASFMYRVLFLEVFNLLILVISFCYLLPQLLYL